MTTKEKALDYFSRHFHCSQAILAAYADKCGLSEDQALKLGGCLGSGMRKGEVCGACTGALMVLGALYGQSDEKDLTSRERSNKVNDELMRLFTEKMGSYLCRDILGCDVSTAEGVKYARENRLFAEKCPPIVANTTEILDEILRTNDR